MGVGVGGGVRLRLTAFPDDQSSPVLFQDRLIPPLLKVASDRANSALPTNSLCFFRSSVAALSRKMFNCPLPVTKMLLMVKVVEPTVKSSSESVLAFAHLSGAFGDTGVLQPQLEPATLNGFSVADQVEA